MFHAKIHYKSPFSIGNLAASGYFGADSSDDFHGFF
jgi:hypothetical protein